MLKKLLFAVKLTALALTIFFQPLETRAAWGDYDQSFGIGGVSEHQVLGANFFFLRRIALQPNGKLLVAGESGVGQTTRLILRRHNADGSLDTSFGYNGEAVEQITPSGIRYVQSSLPSEIAVQSDGKILIGGSRRSFSGAFLGLSVWRFTSNGILDTSFDADGRKDIITSTTDPSARVESVNLTKSIALGTETTKILALCKFNVEIWNTAENSVIYRLNLNGGFDTNFGVGGEVNLNGSFNDIAVYKPASSLTGDLIYAAGADETGTPTIWRFANSGAPDANFAASGKFVADIGDNSIRRFSRAVVQSDGKTLFSGENFEPLNIHFVYLLRLLPSGTPDSQFGSAMLPGTNISGTSDLGINYDLGLQSDGKIISSRQVNYTRYLSNGATDMSFQVPYFFDSPFVIERNNKLVSFFNTDDQGYGLRRTLPN